MSLRSSGREGSVSSNNLDGVAMEKMVSQMGRMPTDMNPETSPLAAA